MNFLNNRTFLFILKLVLFLLISWFIIDHLFIKNDFKAALQYFTQNVERNKLYLVVIVILLMPINWWMEGVKWRQLIKTKVPVGELLRSILAGVALGFVTPGRGGEFIGRVLFLEGQEKARVFYLSTIGGIAQTAVTLVAGVFFVYGWSDNSFFAGLTIGLAIAFLVLYFRFDLLNHFVSSSSFLQRYSLVINQRDLPNMATQFNVLLLALLRYLVYLLQYVLLLYCFGVSDSLALLSIYSGVFLLVQTFSPLMPLLDVSFRGGTALVVFSALTTNSVAILCAVTLVWIINLVIPSLAGYFFILRKSNFGHAV